jgi:cytochrome c-type biogenesis protein CcmH/NrfG
VARGTQHRKRRTGPNARPAGAVAAAASEKHRKHKPPEWQEQLFFQRLRNHAKLVFLFLAIVFALSFVFLGVGSGSTGITEALQNAFNFGGSSGGTSISKLEKKTRQHPGDAQAWRDLATAYETKQRTHDAITALRQYTGLRPKDTGALAELASQYTRQAQVYAQDYQNAQLQLSLATPPSAAFAPPATTALGKAFNDPNALKDPISSAVQTLNQTAQNTAFQNYQSAQKSAEGAYLRIVKLTPNDANAQLQLAQTAQTAGDAATALAAYRRFLKLSPNDPLAGQVKEQIKALQAQSAASTSSSSSK